MKFKMERPNLVKAGDKVTILPRPTSINYSYIIEPAVAMSGCIPFRYALKNLFGTVEEVEETPRGFYVIVAFDEPDPADGKLL